MAKQCNIYPELYASMESILNYLEENEVINGIRIDGKEYSIGDIKEILDSCNFTQKPKDKRKLNQYNIHMSHCLKGTDEFEEQGKQDWQTCVLLYRQLYGGKKATPKPKLVEAEVA